MKIRLPEKTGSRLRGLGAIRRCSRDLDMDTPIDMPRRVVSISALLLGCFSAEMLLFTWLQGDLNTRGALFIVGYLGLLFVVDVPILIAAQRWKYGTFRPTRRMMMEKDKTKTKKKVEKHD